MRIIAGEYRHRRLFTHKDTATTRPIPDRVKESLFSLLRGRLEGASVLDAFAGTGAIGLEAVSRGAARCVCVERDRRVVEILKRNVETLGCAERCEVVAGDALGMETLNRCPRPVDLIFFDPPYALVEDPQGWERVRRQFSRLVQLLTDDGFAVLRTPWPLRHREGGEEQPADPGTDGKRRRRPQRDRSEAHMERGGRWTGEVGEEIELEPEAEEAGAGEGVSESADEIQEMPAVTWRMADLAVEGALGPETHVYGRMAVHLYMKRRATGGAPGA